MTVVSERAGLGTGIYSFPSAARVLARTHPGLNPGTLRRWVRSGLTPASFGRGKGRSDLLSFIDLISLEVVKRFRESGVSLQRIRRLEEALRELRPGDPRPFARKGFFTDGYSIWCDLFPDDDRVIEVIGKHTRQLAWKPAIRSFATEIRYEGGLAAAWELGRWVELDPDVQFGAPVVKGTRLLVSTVAAELEGATAAQVAEWYGLTIDQVEGVRGHLAA